MKRKILKTALFSGAVILMLIAGAVVYVTAAMYRSQPILEGELRVAGLDDTVMIGRDEFGSVLIEASDQQGMMFALGFVHAQERFFQMDTLRRRAAGELAGLLGGAMVESDRRARRHDFRRIAERAVDLLPADERTALSSYTNGVNQGLAKLATAPFEYTVLRQAPREWQREDALLVQMSMYLLLQGGDKAHPELIRSTLEQHYDAEFVQFLLERRSEWDTPLDGRRGIDGRMSLPESLRLAAAGDVRRRPEDYVDSSTMIGSNSWAVSGAMTGDGRAILANDIHLPLSMPNMMFRVALQYTGRDSVVAGIGVPGTPMLVAGSNGDIAWAVTNAAGDFSDLVQLDARVTEVSTRSETIDVRGGDPVVVDIDFTSHGPVVHSDDNHVYALKWAAQEVEANDLGFLSLLTTDSLTAAVDIVASSGIPHLNVLLADATGNAVWTIAGRLPKRVGLAGDRSVAWNGQVGWDGWLETSDYPSLSTADRQTLWTANNRVVSGPALQKIGVGGQFALGVRARRIGDVLTSANSFDEADMHRLQLDDRALLMERWHALTLQVAGNVADPAVKAELEEVLEAWDGTASSDSAAYRVIRRYRDELANDVLPRMLAELLEARPDVAWYEVLSDWESPLWRIVSSQPATAVPDGFESWQAYLAQMLVDNVYDPYKKRYGDLALAVWGDANMVSIRHPLSRAIPMVGKLLDMPGMPMNGDQNVILAQLGSFGPAARMVVSPGNEDDGILTMPGGQAGNPFVSYYGSGHEQWARGETVPLLPQRTVYSLSLTPAND